LNVATATATEAKAKAKAKKERAKEEARARAKAAAEEEERAKERAKEEVVTAVQTAHLSPTAPAPAHPAIHATGLVTDFVTRTSVLRSEGHRSTTAQIVESKVQIPIQSLSAGNSKT
jgi:membrane protein involved in colicin uptake